MYILVMMQERFASMGCGLQDNKIVMADNSGFTKRELARIEKVVLENYSFILKAFIEFC